MSQHDWSGGGAMDGESSTGSKRFGDYLKALRRRFWVVLLIAALIGGGGTAFTLVQKPVYYATSRLLIEPPKQMIQMANENRIDPSIAANYFNTRLNMILTRQTTERVIKDLQLSDWEVLNGVDDPIGELLSWLVVKPVKDTNLIDIGLEGGDPKLAARIVNGTVEAFLKAEQDSMRNYEQLTRSRLQAEITALQNENLKAQDELKEFFTKNDTKFLATGESLENAKMQSLTQAKVEAEVRVAQARMKLEAFKAQIAAGIPFFSDSSARQISIIKDEIRNIDSFLASQKETIKEELYDSNPRVVKAQNLRNQKQAVLDEIGKNEAGMQEKIYEQQIELAKKEVDRLNQDITDQRKRVVGGFDDQLKMASLQAINNRISNFASSMQTKRMEKDSLSGLTTPGITVVDKAEAPILPIRPIKWLQIPLCIMGGIFIGCMVVVGLEFLDRSIRVPEQAAASLDWPLLGVIPKLNQREILWRDGTVRLACEEAGTAACEAFRSLRAGVLGAEKSGALASVLVTSAKSNEGKSFVAANLAATCARAGESVLLVDLDLRKPTLGPLFGVPEDAPGLIEVLQGEVPWDKAINTTTVGNMCLLSSGDASGIPADILGTVEMQQLLEQWTERFDRVILDGPAILGLADSREVGRMVDGIVFVLQAGEHEDRPLQRVRQLCENEQLRPAGIVFNSLTEGHDDFANHTQTSAKNVAPRVKAPAAKAEQAA